jgi:hypothetical protein
MSPFSNSPPSLESKHAARSLDPAYSADAIPFLFARVLSPNVYHTSFLRARDIEYEQLFKENNATKCSKWEWDTRGCERNGGTAANKGDEG